MISPDTHDITSTSQIRDGTNTPNISVAKKALEVHELKVHYPVGHHKLLKAVDGVSFSLNRGEVLGLVGESGSGKSSLAKAIICLVRPVAGAVFLDSQDFLALRGEDLRKTRPQMQMIFQDPYGSLDPRMTVFDILAEPLRAHFRLSYQELNSRVCNELDRVGLSRHSLKRYPHEFSGGQRQRIAIARALILNPSVLIADEPVSSLDVSVQAQILNLLKDIQKELHLAILFISHNLSVVRYIADRIAVMYLGKIIEMGRADHVSLFPQHPYTQALISAVPVPDPTIERQRQRIVLRGEIPSAVNPPRGCAFHTRCPIAKKTCLLRQPTLEPIGQDGRLVSCFELVPRQISFSR